MLKPVLIIFLLSMGLMGVILFVLIKPYLPSRRPREARPMDGGHLQKAPAVRVDKPESYPFQRKWYLLSRMERAYYDVLRQAVAQRYVVFAKVRLFDVLWLPPTVKNRQFFMNVVTSKHADFVLCDPDTMSPVLVIELDDPSHQAAYRRHRDQVFNAVLKSAGLPVLRMSARQTYDVQELADILVRAVGQQSLLTIPEELSPEYRPRVASQQAERSAAST